MLKARDTTTPSDAYTAIVRKGPAQRNNRQLEAACNKAVGINIALEETLKTVAELAPSRPETDAAYAVAERLRPAWRNSIDDAASMEALTGRDFCQKARLIQILVERDEQDNVVGSAPLRLAAALADDLLACEWLEG